MPSSIAVDVGSLAGDDWLHEPKWDGFRFQIIKDGGTVRLYSRHGAEYTDRLPGMVEAFGVDLRDLPLTERKRDLRRLCRKSRVPFMREVQTFPNGPLLLDHCNKFGFEGVVSKRLSSRYLSGPSRVWQKNPSVQTGNASMPTAASFSSGPRNRP